MREDNNNAKKDNKRGIKRWLRATRCSLAGLRAAVQNESAIREELLLIVIMGPLGAFLGQGGVEKALLLGSLLLILIVELLNSAVEAVVDRVGAEYHPLSGRAKDVGSAAVMMTIGNAALIWFCVLFPWS